MLFCVFKRIRRVFQLHTVQGLHPTGRRIFAIFLGIALKQLLVVTLLSLCGDLTLTIILLAMWESHFPPPRHQSSSSRLTLTSSPICARKDSVGAGGSVLKTGSMSVCRNMNASRDFPRATTESQRLSHKTAHKDVLNGAYVK